MNHHCSSINSVEKLKSIIVKVKLIEYLIKQQVPNFATRLHKQSYSHVFKFNDRLKFRGHRFYNLYVSNHKIRCTIIKIRSSITRKIYPLLHL